MEAPKVELSSVPSALKRKAGDHATAEEGHASKYPRVPPSPADAEAPSRGSSYVSLTTHPGRVGVRPVPIRWGEMDPKVRGAVVATNRIEGQRNSIGAHGGSYSVYRALSVATGRLDPTHRPNFELTHPAAKIGPFPAWSEPSKIATLDPFGHLVPQAYAEELASGMDIRPTIAVTRAHMDVPEIRQMMAEGKLHADGKVLLESGLVNVTKAAVESVWYLPEIARRFGIDEFTLRRHLFQQTNGMYPELMTRSDMKVFLPPIGGLSIYIFGNVDAISDPTKVLACRVHDECNGSDVFGSDICTCRPYLAHGIEVCIRTAQEGGVGVIVYFRKEGRALGEVTKYLVYNRRKRQEGGDRAEQYFMCTTHVAGMEDSRFQALMPDALHWLGVTKIDRLVSMSDMKYNAITQSGIEVVERIPIPPERVPADAQVEIDAKVFAGYSGGGVYKVTEGDLVKTKGRTYEDLKDSAAAAPL